MENLSKKQIIIIGIILVTIVIVVVYYIFNSIQQINYENLDNMESDDTEQNEIKSNVSETEELIVVHIAGAVNKEGIVTLKEGKRIIDAINEAGGLKENADLTNVNLAYIISDGQKIYIPHIGEEQKENSEIGENIIVSESKENSQNTSLININTATVAQLTGLSGIGEQTAQKIVNYRKENGKFNNIEEIKNVSGIGEAKYNSIKDYITVK